MIGAVFFVLRFIVSSAAGARPRPTMLISVGFVNVGQGRAPAVCRFTADGDVTCGTGRPIPYEYFLDFAFYCYCIPFNRGIPRYARNDMVLVLCGFSLLQAISLHAERSRPFPTNVFLILHFIVTAYRTAGGLLAELGMTAYME